MAQQRKKARYTPMEIARLLKLSMPQFNEKVNEGALPKGRVGEDGKRYYTHKDLEFVIREYRTQKNTRFLMYTFPLLLFGLVFFLLTIKEVKEVVHDYNVKATPTAPVGFGAPPPQVWGPGTPLPTRPPRPTTVRDSFNDYRQNRRSRDRGYAYDSVSPETQESNGM